MTILADEELEWWQDHCTEWNGKQIHPPLPDHYYDTDASKTGWGAWYFPKTEKPPCEAFGLYADAQTSNVRELTAIYLGMQSFADTADWKSCAVRVRTDNKVAMSYVNRMGGREPHLARIVENLHSYCLERKILLTAEYIPGKENVIADKLSRLEVDWTESRLNPVIFQMIEKDMGPFTLDGMAIAANTQCKRYVSLRHDPGCLYTDFLARPLCHSERAYVNPPYTLIPRIIRKIKEEKLRLVLILPVWPSQPWWPLLWPLCHGMPLILPRHPDLLLKLGEGKWEGGCPKWTLVAMPLSGRPSDTEAFYRELSNSSFSLTNMGQKLVRWQTTSASSNTIKHGAQIMESIATIYRSLTF
jgi:ribonuclease HI